MVCHRYQLLCRRLESQWLHRALLQLVGRRASPYIMLDPSLHFIFLRSMRIWPVRDFKDAVSFTLSYRPNCFSNDGTAIKPTSGFHSGFSVRVCSLAYLPIYGSWNSERRDVSTRQWALQGLQPAPRSPARQPEAAMCPVSAVYHNEVVLESCLRRGYVPAGGTYALGSLFAPRSFLVVEAGSESMKQALQTTN